MPPCVMCDDSPNTAIRLSSLRALCKQLTIKWCKEFIISRRDALLTNIVNCCLPKDKEREREKAAAKATAQQIAKLQREKQLIKQQHTASAQTAGGITIALTGAAGASDTKSLTTPAPLISLTGSMRTAGSPGAAGLPVGAGAAAGGGGGAGVTLSFKIEDLDKDRAAAEQKQKETGMQHHTLLCSREGEGSDVLCCVLFGCTNINRGER